MAGYQWLGIAIDVLGRRRQMQDCYRFPPIRMVKFTSSDGENEYRTAAIINVVVQSLKPATPTPIARGLKARRRADRRPLGIHQRVTPTGVYREPSERECKYLLRTLLTALVDGEAGLNAEREHYLAAADARSPQRCRRSGHSSISTGEHSGGWAGSAFADVYQTADHRIGQLSQVFGLRLRIGDRHLTQVRHHWLWIFQGEVDAAYLYIVAASRNHLIYDLADTIEVPQFHRGVVPYAVTR